ncbi:calcitonin receptor [Elysia marginata]|uniref:Calcitonin receptor n=1 Tax=Elysia marginata TaxID=1093978 RepID=A0AAV4IXE1_9GAST|nr:calcitonin receptor [Elysia marginata]
MNQKRLVVPGRNPYPANTVWCRYLHALAQYFSTTNFSWMCCEGLYLHIIMAHALHTSKKLIKCLIIGGWGVPLVLTAVYAAVRATISGSGKKCWIEEDSVQWIIAGPILASVVINICILINLVRLLMTKLQHVPDVQQGRKAVKATLILVPLFGLQFLVFPVRPAEDSPLHDVYLHFMALLMSLQVQSLIVRKWHQYRLMTSRKTRKNLGFTSSTYVDAYSVVDTTREAHKLSPDNATAAAGGGNVSDRFGDRSVHVINSNSYNKAGDNVEKLEMTSSHLLRKTCEHDRDQITTLTENKPD